jgi:hypothetical protein
VSPRPAFDNVVLSLIDKGGLSLVQLDIHKKLSEHVGIWFFFVLFPLIAFPAEYLKRVFLDSLVSILMWKELNLVASCCVVFLDWLDSLLMWKVPKESV